MLSVTQSNLIAGQVFFVKDESKPRELYRVDVVVDPKANVFRVYVQRLIQSGSRDDWYNLGILRMYDKISITLYESRQTVIDNPSVIAMDLKLIAIDAVTTYESDPFSARPEVDF